MWVGGRLSTHLPGPPSRSWVASAEARIAARESTTRFGRPVEPEVEITNGSGSSAASHSRSSPRISSAVPLTGRRLLTGVTLTG